MQQFTVGEYAYLIESNKYIREGKISRIAGDMCTFLFVEGGGIHVRLNRLYHTEKEAQVQLDLMHPPEKMGHWNI